MKKSFFCLFTIIGLISILTVSCNQEALDIPSNTYSGEEYFKSIFLLQGELTDQIPSLKHFTKYMVPESEESMAAIISRTNEADHSFFSDLKAAIVSKDASKVEMVMDRGNALLEVNALQNSPISLKVEEQLSMINSNDYDFSNPVDVEKFVNMIHGIVNSNSKPFGSVEEIGTEKCLAALLGAVWAWVYYKYKFWPNKSTPDMSPSGLTDHDQFLREKLVSEIVNLN